MFTITHVTINLPDDKEVSYHTKKLDSEFNTVLQGINELYPSATSLEIVLVKKQKQRRTK